MNKKHISIAITIFSAVFIVPLIINLAYQSENPLFYTVWDGSDLLLFYGSALAFIGTSVLGIATVSLSNKSNQINERLLEAQLISTKSSSIRNYFKVEMVKRVYEESLQENWCENGFYVDEPCECNAEVHIKLYFKKDNLIGDMPNDALITLVDIDPRESPEMNKRIMVYNKESNIECGITGDDSNRYIYFSLLYQYKKDSIVEDMLKCNELAINLDIQYINPYKVITEQDFYIEISRLKNSDKLIYNVNKCIFMNTNFYAEKLKRGN